MGLIAGPIGAPAGRGGRAGRRPWRLAVFLGLAGLAVMVTLPATAQELTLNFGEGGQSLTQTSIGLIALVTILSLVPGILVTLTSFPFVLTVLSILRQAIGLQQSPPGMLIVSLALFLTYYVMEPVFQTAWQDGLGPYSRGQVEASEAFASTMAPFRDFMAARVAPDTFAELADLRRPADGPAEELGPGADLSLLIPSFLLSEIERAFQIGFVIFLPFLVIDLVVASILMSMGMVMVPPAMVSLPFKLGFFVLADGWTLLSSALVRGYG